MSDDPIPANPSGLCMCGCGERTSLARDTNPKWGHVKGQPMRFVIGHNHRKFPWVDYVVDDASGCWIWQRGGNGCGYGILRVGRKSVLAHRHYYEQHVGPIPAGLVIDHLCRNPSCVNPAHLEVVTVRENTLRGVGPAARNAVKTHCPKGHAYDDANTHIKKGTRQCRACDRARYHARKARRAAA